MLKLSPSNPLPSLPPWPNRIWAALLIALALGTILIHGFHPFAEDGGLYAAGVEYTLDPSLFSHFTAFVTEHLRFSFFSPAVAALVRLTHLSLSATLLLLAFLAALATMASARALLRRCIPDERSQLAGLALLAAGWTLPIAGTSLYLMDPYVTARSFIMPLSLLAIAYALDVWPAINRRDALRHPAILCVTCILTAAVFHPLMAAYALLFVAALRATQAKRPRIVWSSLCIVLALFCLGAHTFAPRELPAETAAVVTRYYWFLSQWQWYERLGLLGPPAMLALALRMFTSNPPDRSSSNAWYLDRSAAEWRDPRTSECSHLHSNRILRKLALTTILLSILSTAVALLFAHESSATHTIARLQPLREFVLLYAVMLLLLGAAIAEACRRAAVKAVGLPRLALQLFPGLFTGAMAAGLFLAAQATYPASPHVEFPWRTLQQHNPWVRAFLWARDNTRPDALFALDARYVNMDGEDAQTFRAISLRSALPDYSKDGGEASIAPSIAPAWLAAAQAQADLSKLEDAERDRRLAPFAPDWMILQTYTKTAHPCPYNNGTIKVCRFQLR